MRRHVGRISPLEVLTDNRNRTGELSNFSWRISKFLSLVFIT